MKKASKSFGKPSSKTMTTPEIASKVQSITAKEDHDGRPALWVANLQRAAITNFGKSGAKSSGQAVRLSEPPIQRDAKKCPDNSHLRSLKGKPSR